MKNIRTNTGQQILLKRPKLKKKHFLIKPSKFSCPIVPSKREVQMRKKQQQHSIPYLYCMDVAGQP